MCGRYKLDYNIEQLMMRFDAQNNYIGYGPRKEVFPTDNVAVITNKDGYNVIEPAKWGFDNPFSKGSLINARGETIDEKRTFKDLFLESRCIIPATAFFEWKTEGRKKIKYKIGLADWEIFGMAGLYRVHRDDVGNIFLSCVIITTMANEVMSKVHERMPVILSRDQENFWLNPSVKDPQFLKEFIRSYKGSLTLISEEKESQISFF
jgi:putative SOS response-associated peptidase YedK